MLFSCIDGSLFFDADNRLASWTLEFGIHALSNGVVRNNGYSRASFTHPCTQSLRPHTGHGIGIMVIFISRLQFQTINTLFCVFLKQKKAHLSPCVSKRIRIAFFDTPNTSAIWSIICPRAMRWQTEKSSSAYLTKGHEDAGGERIGLPFHSGV
jgi:hypothetical protein